MVLQKKNCILKKISWYCISSQTPYILEKLIYSFIFNTIILKLKGC